MRPTADHRPFVRYEGAPLFAPRPVERAARAQPAALGPARRPARRMPTSSTALVDHARQPRPRRSRGRRGPPLSRDAESMDAPRVRRCRRRAADHPAGRDAAHLRPSSAGSSSRPGWVGLVPRGVKFRVEVDGEARGYVAENHGAAVPPARARPDRRQRPRQPARFRNAGRLVRGPRRADRGRPEIARSPVDDDARPFAARRRRLARQLRAVPLRAGALQRHRHDQLRPSRPVDLHRADQPERRARPRQRRFRHLPAALDGRRGHVPPAVVPPQRDERGDGPDPRRL